VNLNGKIKPPQRMPGLPSGGQEIRRECKAERWNAIGTREVLCVIHVEKELHRSGHLSDVEEMGRKCLTTRDAQILADGARLTTDVQEVKLLTEYLDQGLGIRNRRW
jgi:hypothetical protein